MAATRPDLGNPQAAQHDRAHVASAASAVVARDLGKAYQIYKKPIHRLWDLFLPGGPPGQHSGQYTRTVG